MNVEQRVKKHREEVQEICDQLEALASRMYRDEPCPQSELGEYSFDLQAFSHELGLLTAKTARIAGECQGLRIATTES
jgi:hypothetical protein